MHAEEEQAAEKRRHVLLELIAAEVQTLYRRARLSRRSKLSRHSHDFEHHSRCTKPRALVVALAAGMNVHAWVGGASVGRSVPLPNPMGGDEW